MPYADLDGTRIHYEELGPRQDSGRAPLLMVSGLGGAAIGWDPVLLDHLAELNRVVVYDNRGTGLSDKPNEPYTIAGFAADAVALLDALGIERAHVLGISMGGMIAQELGAHYPARVASLILGCTTPGGRNAVQASPESLGALQDRGALTPDESARAAWRLAYSDDFIATHRDELEADLARTQSQPTPPDAYERHFQATMTLRVFKHLKDITAPTLVMTGRDDVLIPAANSEILAREIPGARLVVFDDAGHGFMLAARDRLLPVLDAFLAEQAARTP
jgi:pimeloyl-ACP methyl ester carboxylesterase